MNKVIEKVRDLFYDTTDYILVLIIIATVTGIIAWRLDSLFDKGSKSHSSNSTEISTSSSYNDNEKDKKNSDLIEKEKNKQKGVIHIVIPEGTLPNSIATILLDYGVISDKFEFLKKSQELGLDTKFRSGEYDINKNSSLEEIIRIIARQQ